MRRTSLCLVVLAGAALSAAPTAGAAGWSTQSVTDPTGANSAALAGIACASRSDCLATGRWEDPAVRSLAADWTGSGWTLRLPSSPVGAVADELVAVSCTGASACTAVGAYDTGSGSVPLVQRWSGSWSVQSAPTPAGASATQLGGVSCSSASACTAVGSYTDATGTHSLAMRWSSGTWSIQTTPDPSSYNALSGVSCDASENCTAVGTTVGGSGPEAIVFARSGATGAWTAQTTPTVSGAGARFLSGVSCDGGGACTAVGVSSDATTGDLSPLAMTRSSGAWSLTSTPPLPAGAQGGSLAGVSCARTAASCTAVGSSYDSSFVSRPLAEDLSSGSWTAAAPSLPTGATAGQLAAVSCSAALECGAAGNYTDANGDLRALVGLYR